MTMIVVTHEMSFARNVANTVAFMEAGKLVEVGPASEVLESPKSPRTPSSSRPCITDAMGGRTGQQQTRIYLKDIQFVKKGIQVKTALIAISAILASTAVHAEGLPDRIKTAGKVVVANQPNYPPMEYKDPATNTLMGVDIDLGLALAKQLGTKVEWADIASNKWCLRWKLAVWT